MLFLSTSGVYVSGYVPAKYEARVMPGNSCNAIRGVGTVKKEGSKKGYHKCAEDGCDFKWRGGISHDASSLSGVTLL